MFRFSNYFKSGQSLIIAEFANAFEGNKETAIEMIKQAKKAGVDAIKFQMFFADELLVPEHPKYQIFKNLEITKKDWFDIFENANKSGLLIFLDIFGEDSLEFSKRFKIDAYKIHPSDMANTGLINKASSKGTSLILSSGATEIKDIENAIDICNNNGLSDYAIMHGFQSYCPVGYADHVDGGSELATIMPIAAFSKGAKLIEKHFTLDRTLKGIDYESSVEPETLKNIVDLIHKVELSFGSKERVMHEDEIKYMKDIKKRIISNKSLKKGDTIKIDDLTYKRAPHGFFADESENVIGKKLTHDIKKNKPVSQTDLE